MIADVWSIITAIATAVLAVGVLVTVSGVWLTYRQGRDAAQAAQALIEAARKQIAATQEHVVVAQRQADAAEKHVDAAQKQSATAQRQADAAEKHVDVAQRQSAAAERQVDAALDHLETAKAQAASAREQAAAAGDQVSAAEEQTKAAQEQTRAAYAQLEATRTPLLIDVSENTSDDSDLDPDNAPTFDFEDGEPVEKADWRRVYVYDSGSRIYVALPLRNVGTGLAVIKRDHVRLEGTDEGGKAQLEAEPRFRHVHRERVAPKETTRILCVADRRRQGDLAALRMSVRYHDFLGNQRTLAHVLLHQPPAAGRDGRQPAGPHEPNYWRVRQIDYEEIDKASQAGR